jgi:hypothetical protein
MGLIPFETKLARFQAVERDPSGKVVREYDRQRRAVGVKKRRLKAQRKRRRFLKSKTHVNALLAAARAAMGYRPLGKPGKKFAPEHMAALHAGRDRYHQAKREKKCKIRP